MKIKAIKTEQDYKDSLELLESLMLQDPVPGTDASDQLAILSTLIESYESNAFPTNLPSAIDAIKFRMEQLNLRPADLVPYIGSPSRVSEVLSGKRALTVDMIRSLEGGLGIPSSVLLKKPDPTEDNIFETWDKRLFALMKRRGYFDGISKLKSSDILNTFFGNNTQLPEVTALLRQSSYRSSPTTDPYALVAWSRQVLNQAGQISPDKKYVPGSIDLELMTKIAQLSEAPDGPTKAQAVLLDHGIVMIVEPPLPKTRLDGAAILNDGKDPIIGMTLRIDRVDNFWFTLMHELAHVSLHYDKHEIQFFYDELEDVKGVTLDDREKEADALAGEALIPSAKWEVSPARIIPSPLAASSLAKELNINVAIVAGRIRYESGKWGSLSKVVQAATVRHLFNGKAWE